MALRFVTYKSKYFPKGVVGLADASGTHLKALAFPSGQVVTSLYDLIESWDSVSTGLLPVPGVPLEALEDVEVLAPLTGRDVLAVGKNYKDHAKEFQQSGFDSSDKNEQPDFPVIFTKRASSIVPNGHPIYPHPSFTDTLDYEGELGVIIGKGGIGIKKEDAWKHVWGAVVLNDMTARERQRDHKQFFIGKSLDTFCPMGTYAVHASSLDWNNMELVTKINGEVRQSQNTKDLIFDIPTLIETISAGITMMPGDLIATGTPAGVGIGKKPPIYLKSGDKMEVSITGLGVLTNVVGDPKDRPDCAPVRENAVEIVSSTSKSILTLLSGQKLHVEDIANSSSHSEPLLFIHGLGGASTSFYPLIKAAGFLETRRVILVDWEGHGMSPLSGSDGLTVEAIARSYAEVLDALKVEKAVVFGHSLGGLIATQFASAYPEKVSRLILIGPVKRIGAPGVEAMTARAKLVREQSMGAVVDAILSAGISATSQATNYLAQGFIKSSLLATNAEGYARACLALAGFQSDLDYSKITVPTLIIAGNEDKTCPAATVEFLKEAIMGSKVVTLKDVGHWHMLEDVGGVAAAVKGVLTYANGNGK